MVVHGGGTIKKERLINVRRCRVGDSGGGGGDGGDGDSGYGGGGCNGGGDGGVDGAPYMTLDWNVVAVLSSRDICFVGF